MFLILNLTWFTNECPLLSSMLALCTTYCFYVSESGSIYIADQTIQQNIKLRTRSSKNNEGPSVSPLSIKGFLDISCFLVKEVFWVIFISGFVSFKWLLQKSFTYTSLEWSMTCSELLCTGMASLSQASRDYLER